MKVLAKDHPLTTKILLKDTKPFEKYVKPDGCIIEVCASTTVLENTGRLAPRKSPGGKIYVYNIEKNGERRKSTTEKGKDEYTVLDPDLEVEPMPRRGPRRRDDGLWWRGWGRKNSDKMDALVRIVGEEGFYVKWPDSRKNHYANIGFEGTKLCALFFSGNLGFSEKPDSGLAYYPAIKKEGYTDKNGKFNNAYMPYQLDLSAISEKDKWAEFETVFRRQVKEWKRLLVHRAKRAL